MTHPVLYLEGDAQVVLSHSGQLRHFDASLKETVLHEFRITETSDWYWYQVRLFLLWLGEERGTWGRAAFKTLKRFRNESKAKEWRDVLPPEIVRWATRTLGEMSEGYSCVDNSRVALMRNTSQMRRYRSQLASGCCGFCDAARVGPDGQKYLLGFNYGH